MVDAAAHTLVRDGQPQALEPKAFAVLLALLRRPGELLGREVQEQCDRGERSKCCFVIQNRQSGAERRESP